MVTARVTNSDSAASIIYSTVYIPPGSKFLILFILHMQAGIILPYATVTDSFVATSLFSYASGKQLDLLFISTVFFSKSTVSQSLEYCYGTVTLTCILTLGKTA